jgi:DNA polymerase-3 subunit alpha
MRRAIVELRPDNTAELMALVALYRPGPMQHIGTYCRAKHDRSQIKYPHPDLAEILDETYGVITYQDQVLMVMQKFAGYGLADADGVRKAMSKKIAELMQKEGEKFIKASVKNGYTPKEAEAIFQLIEPFAGYAFNKAHSAVYGTIAYQTAYLKANYPHEYMTAVLRSAGTHERIAEAVAECVRLGIEVLPPDIIASGVDFELQEAAGAVPIIRFGLMNVKNVGEAAAQSIVDARTEGGEFKDIEDFIKRADLKALNRRSLEALIKAGALDSVGGNRGRGTLLGNVDRIISLAQREAKLKESGQSTMFDMFGDTVATPLPALELVDDDVSKAEMLSWEKELLGVYVSEHPFSSAAATTSKHVSALVSEITADLDGREVVIAGMVNGVRHLATKQGKPFIAVMVEDLSGTTEVTVWSDVYEPTRDVWSVGNILLMQVRVKERGDRLQASVSQASLVQAADGSVSHEHFEIPDWLTAAVRENAGVSVAQVQDNGRGVDRGRPHRPPVASSDEGPAAGESAGSDANGHAGGNGAAPADLEPATRDAQGPATKRTTLRFFLHESDDHEADRERLDALIALIQQHPGSDAMRLFIHGHDGDKIELTLPDGAASESLRDAGIQVLGEGGGAEPLKMQRTRGIEAVEVV